MAYKTVKISWMPRSQKQWNVFTAARKESARLWNDMVLRHARIRRRNLTWPSKVRWERWAKGRYPGLHSQTVQQIIGEFCEAVNATRQLKKNGHDEASYPWRLLKYRDVVYTNQAARLQPNGCYALPHGANGKLFIKIPAGIKFPGRLMEVRLCMGHVLFSCEVPNAGKPAQIAIGSDLGVNTLIAATDGRKALLVSGREIKATVQWRNKNLASIQARQSNMTKGSRRWKRLQRRKAKMLTKAANRINDLTHNVPTHIVFKYPVVKRVVRQDTAQVAQFQLRSPRL